MDRAVEFVALWLHHAAHRHGLADAVRRVVRRAADEAIRAYGLPESADESPVTGDEVVGWLARFAASWDEAERERRLLDGPPAPAPLADALTAGRFLSLEELCAASGATRRSARHYLRGVRERRPELLQVLWDGGRRLYRLKGAPG